MSATAARWARRPRPPAQDSRSELIGILVAIVVLLLGFGSVLAAGLPILTAVLGMAAALGVLGMAAAAFTFPSVSPTLAVMMGLGVGIDYALFLTTRHRQQIIDGADPAEAAGRTVSTSGRAVLIAAVTVIIAMLGLYASGIGFLGTLGVAAAIGVAVGAVSAMTLVPALLGLAGRRIDRFRVRRPAAEASAAHAGWARYAAAVGAHPWRFMLAGVVFLCVLAIPVLSLQLGHVDAGADPASYTDKRAYDAISSAFGPGANGTFTVVIQPGHGAGSTQGQQLAGTVQADLAAAPGVAAVSPVQASPDGAILVTTVVPGSRPQDVATSTLLSTLRDTTLPEALSGTGARGYVTGITAEQLDFRDQVGGQLPVVIAVVIAAAFLLLLATFRSPVLALKAAAANLLSIGAAYGVLVVVFEWGWGSSVLGVSEKIPIESYVPMMMFAIVFGLSMDYEVFLLSRIREAWTRTRDNHASVAAGLASTARVITCGADHGQRVPVVPAVHQRRGQDAGPGPRGERPHRCHRDPVDRRARDHVPAGPLQLVDPGLAGPGAAAPGTRGPASPGAARSGVGLCRLTPAGRALRTNCPYRVVVMPAREAEAEPQGPRGSPPLSSRRAFSVALTCWLPMLACHRLRTLSKVAPPMASIS